MKLKVNNVGLADTKTAAVMAKLCCLFHLLNLCWPHCVCVISVFILRKFIRTTLQYNVDLALQKLHNILCSILQCDSAHWQHCYDHLNVLLSSGFFLNADFLQAFSPDYIQQPSKYLCCWQIFHDQLHCLFQGVVGVSTVEALEEAVQKYKVLAKQVEPHSDQAKDIICRLVQLRMKLFEAKVWQRQFSSRHTSVV